MELIRKRKAGELTTDDINSYRNTPVYKLERQKKITNRDIVKTDIDNVLPTCRNYEELLERLRDLGYHIRDKKKDGGWVAHIAFQAPLQDKATREVKIGDGSFYTRELLEEYIAKQAKELELEGVNHVNCEISRNVSFFEEYEYGITDLTKINDDYKTVQENVGTYITIQRTATEKKILADIRKTDITVHGLIETIQLHKIIAEQNSMKQQKKPYITKTQEQRLVAQIQTSFQCLRYTEQHHIFSYKQIIDLYTGNKAKYEATIDNFNKAETAISNLKNVLLIHEKLTELEAKIDSKKGNVNYILEEYNSNKRVADKYKAIMEKNKIDTPQGEEALRTKVAEYDVKQQANRGYMSIVINTMSELENCIRTFDRIDREHGKENNKAMQIFESLISDGSDEELAESQQDKRESTKGRDDR